MCFCSRFPKFETKLDIRSLPHANTEKHILRAAANDEVIELELSLD
jgi:hypothetical protein